MILLLVNKGSGNGLLPNDSMPLPEPMLFFWQMKQFKWEYSTKQFNYIKY